MRHNTKDKQQITLETLDYSSQRIAILGYGMEGRSAYRHLKRYGASDITICDGNKNLELPKDVTSRLGEDYLEGLDDFDLIFRSPGVLPWKFTTDTPVTSVMDRFLRLCPATAIGVTGSKGKGTTATLVHRMLEAGGLNAYLGGNIGLPPLDFLEELSGEDCVVLEMSNLQLWDIGSSPDIAVLLMITREHLDWHRGDMDEYVATKANITAFQRENDVLVHHGSNRYTVEIAGSSQARKVPYYAATDQHDPSPESAYIRGGSIYYGDNLVCDTGGVRLLGRHNLENVCAAVAAAWQVVEGLEPIRQAIKGFAGLPHRLEYVTEKSGVEYYDDSIGTTPEAAMAAIEAFERPKVLIMGGSSKDSDFTELTRQISTSDVKGVVLLGDTAEELEQELQQSGFRGEIDNLSGSTEVMYRAVERASRMADSGDAVLLAPACASFGLFANYKDRGEQFQLAVNKL